MVPFHTPILFLELYVPVRGNQSMLNNKLNLHTVVNALGSVVDMYTIHLVKQPLLCFVVRAAYTCLLALQELAN